MNYKKLDKLVASTKQKRPKPPSGEKKRGNQPKPLIRHSKSALWLRYYLDESNPETFLRKASSARAAGYRCKTPDQYHSVGAQVYYRVQAAVDKWLDEAGLSETALKTKLLSLLEGTTTKLQTVKGKPKNLKPNVEVLAEMDGETFRTDEGTVTKEGETLLAIEMKDLELQRRTLDMALKHKGMYAPEIKDIKVLIEISPAKESQVKVIDVIALPQEPEPNRGE